MRKYGFDNMNGTTFDWGIHFLEFPTFNYGHEIINDIEVAGRSGTLTERTGTYTDTIISNNLEFDCSCVSEYENKIFALKEWIRESKKIVYSDMEDRYFIVKKVEISEETRMYGTFGNINVVFTCHPGVFMKDGDYPVQFLLEKRLFNPYSESCPIYHIEGNGQCTLKVNGKIVTAEVDQNLTIDTERMISYRLDGALQNTSIIGKYEDLYLEPKENKIEISAGFTIKVIPKWRILR